MQEIRRFLRWNRARNGQIYIRGPNGTEIVGCWVTSLSHSSAVLHVAASMEIPLEFQLSLDGIAVDKDITQRVDGIPSGRDCWIMWRSNGRIGIAFDPSETLMAG